MRQVLLIEADASLADTLATSLEQANYAVTVKRTAREGLQSALEKPPRVIVLNYLMPDLDCAHFCEMLHENPQSRDVPVIVLTDRITPDEVERMETLCVDEYLVKPFPPDYLVRIISELLVED